ncbi:hypothetical protein FFT09_07765 [Saccharomonospora piscinae]|uniref:septum formation family protein n=1 Tax=Saccharomonospora piscinae TaxID=687388 RepID=UPI001106951E|nr:septum formation family protein [Saccharomonospora piscinae]TLW93299.1 hypothetical protein FFT09_07765 [Saccharomonospora piscinae]
MSRHGLALTGAVLLAAVSVTSCVTQVDGTAAPPATTQPAAEPGGSDERQPSRPDSSDDAEHNEDSEGSGSIADPGECVRGGDPEPVDCEQPHTVEVTAAGTFGGAMADEPLDRDEVFEAVFPSCRDEAADYLGSDQFDLTTLSAWLLWAGEDAWERGERWYRCGVAELDDENQATERSGSIRNTLRGDGVHTYRLCSLTRPSQEPPAPTPCDRPHRGEAVSLVPMGEHSDPLPTEDEFAAAARETCDKAVIEYLGAQRDDVSVAWRWPDEVAWQRGFNNFTCYLETESPVSDSLRGVRTSPLPN